MKIIELRSENVKRIKAIEIRPKDNVVIISGKNGQGKTSVLDSIWFALQGKVSMKGTPMPIRKGQTKAEVQLTLDNFIITRKWTDNNKSYLKVTNREGLSYSSPQELLNNFIGSLTFDPLEFAQMKDETQRNLLLRIADIDIDSYNIKIAELKEERRLKGQEVKLLSGQRENVSREKIPQRLININELNKELEMGLLQNTKIVERKLKQSQFSERITELEEELANTKKNLLEYNSTTPEYKRVDIEKIKERIKIVDEGNELYRANERNIIADKKQKEVQEDYNTFTKKIESILKEKETILSNARMPIPGLGIDEIGITYNKIPFSQLASSEQLKISLAIAIALNPKLKIIRITDGSLLDSDNMEFIEQLAKEKDYQIWIEKVDGTGNLGFYIEDGEIA